MTALYYALSVGCSIGLLAGGFRFAISFITGGR